MKKIHLLFLFLLSSVVAFAQTSLSGTIVNQATGLPVQGISVHLQNSGHQTITRLDGSFLLENVNPGSDVLVVSSPGMVNADIEVEMVENQANDIGTKSVQVNDVRRLLSEGSLLLLDENSVSEEGDQSDYNILSLLSGSDDIYASSTSFNFSAMRFRLRGYDNRYSDMFINGVNMGDPERGGFSYGMIGGLNDATRNKDVVTGMSPSTFTFGQIGGSGNINTTAASQARGGRIGVAYTNRNYTWRGMATYNTGLMSNGWALTASLGYRYANEGFIEGTFYNSLGYLLAVSKQINKRHTLSLTTFGSPTQRAQQSPVFQEMVDLMGNKGRFYNSYWGFQDGEKRNSRIVTVYEPVAILQHEFKINRDTKLTTGLGFRYTSYGGTRLDWFDAPDPRPDYYRNLPSYQSMPDMQKIYTDAWRSGNPNIVQVNWEELYRLNSNVPIDPLTGGKNAMYKVEEQHNDQQLITLNSTLNSRLSDRITLTAGVNASTTKGMHYKTINDLLGADYSKDIDSFSKRDFPDNPDLWQNDLNNPDRLVKEGERFGYDYDIFVNKANVWLANIHQYRKWDLYYGFNIGYTEFWREGNMRNGRAPDNSYGKGETHRFIDQGTKLGLTYKLSGRHMFSGNISYQTLPPLAANAYISPRIKDDVVSDLQSEKVFSADLRYDISTPKLRGSVSVFQTNFYDQVQLFRYYSDVEADATTNSNNTFINHALEGINKVYRGVEAAARFKLNSNFTLSAAGTIAEYFYSNRPMGTISAENGMTADRSEIVYLKNFYIGGTPQTAGTIGIQYFNNYWFLNLDLNGFARTYVDVSPIRRIASTFDFIPNSEEEYYDFVKALTQQEKFAGGYTLDFSIGKSFRLGGGKYLNMNLAFNNILNNTALKTGGFEQGRLDASGGSLNVDDYNMTKFPNRYFFAQGFNCFLNATFRF